jgi:GNAT superfamily N-acetyltransferase
MPGGALATPMADYVVSRADPSLMQAALSILPELMGSEALPSTIWIASPRGESSLVLGAAAFVPVLRDFIHPGFRCMLRVVPAYRRQRVGHRLLGALAAEATDWNVPYLHAWRPVTESSSEAQILQALGFRSLSSMCHFIGRVDRALPASTRLEASLRARCKVPGGMTVVPLQEVPRNQVVSLYQRQLGGSPASVDEHITRVLRDEQARAISVGAWDGQRLHGFMLVTLRDGLPQADLWVSEPDQRNGWVAALTLNESLRRIAAAGFGQYRFHCNEHVRATMNFARRSGAECVSVAHCMGLDMKQAAAT